MASGFKAFVPTGAELAGIQAHQADVAPVEAGERISSIDALRGFAVLGILLMNILDFGLPEAKGSHPTGAAGDSRWNWLTWWVVSVVASGKMRAIFSMLFGAGVILLTTRAEARGGRERLGDIYTRRNLWLLAFGLAHAYLLYEWDILFHYAVVGLMLFPFRVLSPRWLLALAVAALALDSLLSLQDASAARSLRDRADAARSLAAAGRPLSNSQLEDIRTWDRKIKKPGPEEIADEVRVHRSGYVPLFWHRAKRVASNESSFFYRRAFLDVFGSMLLGMALMKLGAFSAACDRRLFIAMILLGYGIGVPLNVVRFYRDQASGFDPVIVSGGFLSYQAGRLSIALGHVAVLMLVLQAGWLRGLTARLAAVGRMALTNYLGTTVICYLIFNRPGLGLFGRMERYQLYLVVLGIWALQLVVSPIWLSHFRFGPMEWVWRSLTYWHPQPWRSHDSPVGPRRSSGVGPPQAAAT